MNSSCLRRVLCAFLVSCLSSFTVATVPKPALPFVENQGQFPEAVRFVASDRQSRVSISAAGIHYRLGRDEQILTEFPLGKRALNPVGIQPSVTRVNDFRGADSSRWLRDLPTYETLGLGEVFPGIALDLQHNAQGIEKVFRVQPGASVATIAMGFDRNDSVTVEPDGALLVAWENESRSVRFSPPLAYQELGGRREPVSVRYELRAGGYGFVVGEYRQDLALVIDPSLIASTFIGGDGYDETRRVVIDKSGNVVVAGTTTVRYDSQVVPFPIVAGGFDMTLHGGAGSSDIFVARFDSELRQMLNMTFLGSRANDSVNALVMAPDGSFYLAGHTDYNPDFPTTADAFQRSGSSNSGGYLSHLSSNLSTLVASTVFDVWDYNNFIDIALDGAGNVFVAGHVNGSWLPNRGGYDTTHGGWEDAMVLKFTGALTQLLGATYLGGKAREIAFAIAVDASGRVYVTGEVAPTQTPTAGPLTYDFPTTPGTFMPTGTGCSASFVSRFDNTLTQLQASTFIGVTGSSDVRCGYTDNYGTVNTRSIVINAEGKVYIAGSVDSVGLPITGGVQPVFAKQYNGHASMPFAVRMDADLKKVEAATHFGGSNWYDSASQLALTSDGRVVLGGSAGSSDFPTTIDAFETRLNEGVYNYNTYDAYVAVFSPDLSKLSYATLIGGTRQDTLNGVAVGPDDSLYLVGQTQGVWDPAQNFPTTAGAFDNKLPDWGLDGFIAKIKIPEVLSVVIKGVGQMIPGTEADFELRYRSSLKTTANDVVVLVDLQPGFEFAGSSQGGEFFTNGRCTNQMFWSLGNLPAGSEGTLRFRMRVPAGTPSADYPMTARISASNAPDKPFDVAPYTSFSGVKVASTAYLTPAEASAALLANAALGTLFDYAKANGYGYTGTATRVTFTDGQQSLRYQMVSRTDGAPTVLTFTTDRALIEVFRGKTYLLFDQNGGLTWNRNLGSVEFSGTWADMYVEGSASPLGGNPQSRVVKMGRCNFNCMINLIPEMTLGKISQIYTVLSMTIDCIKCTQAMRNGQTGDASVLENCSKCGASAAEAVDAERVVSKIPGIGDAATIVLKLHECVNACAANPDSHVCTQDRYDCSCFGNWLLGGVCKTACNKTTGTFAPISNSLFCQANEVCNAASCNSSGYESCCRKETDLCPAGTKSCDKKTLRARAAHDPNAKLADKQGDTLAGTQITYTLQYENMGTGDALNVFVVDKLSASFNDATLSIQNGGTYDTGTRLLQWNIGTLTPGQKGEVKFSVALRADLASGTEVTNQADVYFPSALEITPTNIVLHVIRSVAAHEQTVTAVAGMSSLITLRGEGPGNVTYELLGQPAYGTLMGTAPSLTYTPSSNFSGVDRFSFRVSAGGQTSSAANVTLEVAPNPADTTPPTVVSVSPTNGATGVPVSGGQIAVGYYLPVIEAVLSEPVDAASVTTSSFTVAGVAGNVAYDVATHTARFWPKAQLAPGRAYSAVLAGVKDLKGNAMAAPFGWTFTTTMVDQTIDFGALSDKLFGSPPFTVSATATSGLAVTFSSTTTSVCTVSASTVTLVAVGSCTIAANQAGNATYNAAPQVTRSITVGKASQTIGAISFSPSSLAVNGTTTASATATSSLAVSFSTTTPGVCTVSGSTVTGIATGTCTVAANQVGNGNYSAAPQVTQSITVSASITARLVNLSTRGQVLTGDNVMIGGFVIGGSTPKKVLIRAVGPTLANYGVSGALPDPTLQLNSGSTAIVSNDDWGDASNAAEIQATGLAPSNALESAILSVLNPGAYTAIVSGYDGATGVGIVEVFEQDNPATPFTNISTRGQVLTGDNVMIGGFVIQGSSSKTVLIRAVGPNLANYGVTGVLANPTLQLFAGPTMIASNDNWQTASNAAAIQATGLTPVSPLESAILITLPPGAYTAIVSGANGGTGVGIIEVFAQ